MKTCNYFFLTIILGVLPILQAQELNFVTDLPVPDSIRQIDYSSLKKFFLNTDTYNLNRNDSILLEVSIKSLLQRSRKDQINHDFAGFYVELGNFRKSLNILDFGMELALEFEDDKVLCSAFLGKGILYYENDDYGNALKFLLDAYEYSRSLEDPYYNFYIKYVMGVIESKFGNREKAIHFLKDTEACFLNGKIEKIFKFKNSNFNNEMLHDIRYTIAYTYLEMGYFEEALSYIDQVGEFATKENKEEYFESYLGLKGAILIKKGDYSEGLNFTNAYLYNSRLNDASELSHSYAIQGIAYDGLGLIQQSVVAFKNSDSLHQASGADYFFPELKTTLSKLYDYHTSTDNTEKQIEYLNKIIAYEEQMATFKNEIGRKVEENYSIPELIADRDALIAGLEKKNSLNTMWIILASIIGCICLLVAIFQFKKRLLVRKRFEELSADLSLKTNRAKNVGSTKNKNAPLAQLDAKQIESIALSLETFENKKGFLKNNITLQSLAQDLGTNSSYLSKYINAIKAENFSTYLSNLRIHYVLDELYESKILRSYTIQAIAGEIGFTTAKSFSSHFKRVTGMTVSYFLKNIELEKSYTKEDIKLKAVVTMKDSISKVS